MSNAHLVSCETLWAELVQKDPVKDHLKRPPISTAFGEQVVKIAEFLTLLISQRGTLNLDKQSLTKCVKLLAKMTGLQEGKGTLVAKECLLKPETVDILARQLMRANECPDNICSNICIIYQNCFFLDREKLENSFNDVELFKTVLNRCTQLHDEPIELDHLYFFTRLFFLLGVSTTASGVKRKEVMMAHLDFIKFMINVFHSFVEGEFWKKEKVCRGINDILLVLYNLTSANAEFLQDLGEDFLTATMRNIVRVLATSFSVVENWNPHDYSQLDGNNLLSVKLNLVNILMGIPKVFVAHYGTSREDLNQLGELLNFMVFAACKNSQHLGALAPLLILLNQACLDDLTFSRFFKKYIFKEDASNNRVNPNKKDLGGLRDEGESLRNYMLDLMTSSNYAVKTYCGKLLYACCEKEKEEFLRLCGLGNGIATLQMEEEKFPLML